MTIIFDIGHVLLGYDWMIPARKLAAITGLEAEEILQRLEREQAVWDFSKGHTDGDEFTAEVGRVLGHELTVDQLKPILEEMFWDTDGMAELVGRLKPRYQLMLLSNTNPWHWAWEYERSPVLREFDQAILSFEVGCVKPDARIFELALAKANSTPVVFFDDVAEYVEAARKAAIDAYVFESAAQAERQLRELGCEF